MKFFTKETSEKLAKLGCKSESNEFGWREDNDNEPAFAESDFLSTSEQAKENCRIVWNEVPYMGTLNRFSVRSHKIAMLDSEDAEQYLLDTMRKE